MLVTLTSNHSAASSGGATSFRCAGFASGADAGRLAVTMKQIFEVHTRNMAVDGAGVDFLKLAAVSKGLTGAEIEVRAGTRQ